MCCYLTRTTKKTHQLIKENLHETPTYGGWVEAKGPRYCPSIEDKVRLVVYIMSFFMHTSFLCSDTSFCHSLLVLTQRISQKE